MKKIILPILMLITTLAFSQQEASVWYFGHNAGIKFNSNGSVTALTDGQLSTNEGCATISDTTGNLLFYTDGSTVWNKNHAIMSNGTGLMGNWSSTQSATIVPKPGSNTLFYIFTLDSYAGANGFRYSIVDISLDGGLGAVTANKNVLVYTPSNEKLAIVKHANDTDFWIVTHGWNNNSFYSYLLTASGLNIIPIQSNVGVVTNGSTDNVYGYMKISPNGKKLAICNSTIDAELLDFDNSTGLVTNPLVLLTNTPNSGFAYGAEFSPNSEILYITNISYQPSPVQLIQYNLLNQDIVGTAQILHNAYGNIFPTALQLGPNDKIYIGEIFADKLGVINNPDVVGSGCNIQMDAIDLNGKLCVLGLPPFVTSFFYTPAIQLSNVCVNQNTTFEFNTNQTIISATWDFGDGTTSNIISPTHNYTSPGTYPVSVNIVTPNGTGSNTRNIVVYAQPSLLSNTVSLKQCDDNQDGFSAFNLQESKSLLVADIIGLTFTYYETAAEAQNNTNPISNATAYTNQTVNNDIVYVRVENANGCFKVAQLNLVVSTTSIPSSFQIIKHECDDVASGSNTDGITTFDFSDATTQIQNLFPTGQLLTIKYYKNVADALAETNAITNTSSYANIGYPNSQDIYVRVDSQVNNECLGLGHHITLKSDRIPIVQPQVIKHCDDNQDGVFTFNTANLQSTLLNGLTNVTVIYTDTLGNPTTIGSTFTTTSQTINVSVKNTFGKLCEFNTTIQFIVDDLPEAFAIPTTLTTVCDDEADPALQDGIVAFDTSGFQSAILGTQTGMTVNYFDANSNPLNPFPNPFPSTTQTITAEVVNPANTSCKASVSIPLIVNPVPKINLTGTELICSDNPSFTKVINAGLLNASNLTNYAYTWYFNGVVIPSANQYSLTVNTEGTYTVEVKNAQGCFRTRTITVTASNQATIDSVIVTDLVGENSIVVLLSSSSLGNYVYSLDNEIYQTSNTFTNVLPGVYTIYVKDTKGCGITPKEVSVLGIPKYFTPNGDGYNDYWNIDGVNQKLNAKSTICIFDRYGKLLKKMTSLSQGWDGKYNGYTLPSDDYWYTIQLEDGRLIKGNFSLKR